MELTVIVGLVFYLFNLVGKPVYYLNV